MVVFYKQMVKMISASEDYLRFSRYVFKYFKNSSLFRRGIIIVSPSLANATAACTFVLEQLNASINKSDKIVWGSDSYSILKGEILIAGNSWLFLYA